MAKVNRKISDEDKNERDIQLGKTDKFLDGTTLEERRKEHAKKVKAFDDRMARSAKKSDNKDEPAKKDDGKVEKTVPVKPEPVKT